MLGGRLWRPRLRQTEVQDPEAAVLRDDQALGLEATVHAPGGVCPGEARGGLRRDVECPLRRQRTVGKHRPQRLPLDQLHRDVRAFFRGADFVDDDDVGVAERRDRTRLFLEPQPPLRVLREL